MKVIANKEAGYACLPILRVASSSITQTLVKAGASWNPVEECDSLYKFAFVRDPVSRLLSVYNNLVQLPDRPDRSPDHPYPNELLRKHFLHFRKGMSFGDFTRALPSALSDPHLTPQSILLKGFDADFIGKFETLENNWEGVQLLHPEFKLPDLKHLNKSTLPPRRLPNTEELGIVNTRMLWASVRSIYAEDIGKFGYASPLGAKKNPDAEAPGLS